ncbi:nitrate reductase molybdenum cofactor assembly chaperone [Nocardia cyriacigeorgica]|uniref:nitrate reductase molybdenum cofactor assembly chaperone n=1 Tax=Nocardia cyriacigeorgica TaxID=135487 RepID=UPI0018940572|nr:nitrate reductase molybdenum cofactor assembly chaperone [Nocardia cyriacigeorgica]MBF6434875.1 nitrate reductase molybdenum cofactor assembly chaperone [Nocardia cyriacigeorgica]
MRWRRHHDNRAAHRLVWQSASLLLAYPDDAQSARLATVETLCDRLGDERAEPLRATVGYLRRTALSEAARHYVDTFDLQRRTTLLLTYWTDGDTRNRGTAMLAFAQAYRAAGAAPPKGEAPDHLAVVLEFAATVDPHTGGELLTAHRPAIDAVHTALAERRSPYAGVLGAVAATLPAATDQDVRRARELVAAGPPAEQVGLQPFTLTVPPRRAAPERGGR